MAIRLLISILELLLHQNKAEIFQNLNGNEQEILLEFEGEKFFD